MSSELILLLHKRRFRVLIVFGILFVGLAGLSQVIRSLQVPLVYRKDLIQEYVLAKASVDRVDPYVSLTVFFRKYIRNDPDSLPIFPHPTPHPPSLVLFLLPFSLLSYEVMAWVWCGLEILFLGFSVYTILFSFGVKRPIVWGLILTIGLIGCPPVTTDLVSGQLNTFLLAVVVWAWLALDREKDLLAGLMIGLGISLKLIIWPICLLFILRRKMYDLFTAIAVFVVLNLFAAGLLGWDPIWRYYTQVPGEVLPYYRNYAFNVSLTTLGWRLFEGTGSELLVGISADPVLYRPELAQVVSTALSAIVLISSVIVILTSHDLDANFGFLVCVSLLMSPVMWTHYIVLTLLPLALALKRWYDKQIRGLDSWILAVDIVVLLILSYEPTLYRLASLFAYREGPVDLMVTFGGSMFAMLPSLGVVLLGVLLWRNRIVPRSEMDQSGFLEFADHGRGSI